MRVVTEERLAMIKDTFSNTGGQISNLEEESAFGIKKIQEMLLNMKDKKNV
jgi:hypothetical protein